MSDEEEETSRCRTKEATAALGELSRRQFLQLGGAVCIGAPLRAFQISGRPSVTSPGHGAKGILIDITRCVGCDRCTIACLQRRGLGPETTVGDLTLESELGPPLSSLPSFDAEATVRELTPTQWIYVDSIRIPQYGRQYIPRQCMHCIDAACVSACPVEALHKTELGPVIFRDERCIGCRYCMIACPFDIPRFEWDKPLSVIRKCDFCVDWIAAGKEPACVPVCPQLALLYGDRQTLIAEAERRIQAYAGRYVNHIYGKDEVGGTSLLYLSRVPFAELGFRTDLGTEPLPARTQPMMSNLPLIVVGLTVLFGGLNIITRRRGSLQPTET